MDITTITGSITHLLGSIQLDDSSISLIALLAGMVGGYRLTGWHEQFKAKRARVTADKPRNTRKPG
jgi:hypothetical protein